MKNSKQVVIIMGAPGSGKGTQATLLSEKLNLYYIETSKIIEANIMGAEKGESVVIDGKKYLLEEEARKWKAGLINSPSMVTFWMKNRIGQLAEGGENLILAGSPRTAEESKELMPFLSKLYGKQNIKTVLLEISAQESIFRNSHRRICELMRHPVLYSRKNEKLIDCPLDGSKLVRRKGLDDPKTIKTRLERYKEQTLPVIDYLEKNKFWVKKINGLPAPAIVFANILKALGEK
ncbi:MAG: nucleoside monophosphate kinase [Candidatus Nealsonbacteria bacterium]|nr:nucleoside monophosphate kinase [Candidatus Nealsonbacteria bacterium]